MGCRKQSDLVVEPLTAKDFDCVGSQPFLAFERNIGGHKLAHLVAQSVEQLQREIGALEDTAVITAAERDLDSETCAGIKLVESLVEQHTERPRIAAVARWRVGSEKFDLLRRKDRIAKVFGLVVDTRTDRFETVHASFEAAEDVEKCLASRYVDIFVEILAIYFQGVAHGCLKGEIRKG